MATYSYLRNRYYIHDKRKITIPNDCETFPHDFQWILQLQEKNFDLNSDPNLKKGEQYLGFIHELSHYYQDLSLCSCISEHIYKTRVLKHYIDTTYFKIDSPVTLTQDEIDIYKTIYETPISVERESVSDFSKGIRNLHFINNDDHYFPAITYKDLLECYAEMKAWQTIICETSDSESNHKYIRMLLTNRYNKLGVDENGLPAVSFEFEREGFDRYSIVRLLFLSFFHHCKPSKFCIYNKVTDNSQLQVIDYLASMGEFTVEEVLSNLSNGYSALKTVEISDTDYLVSFERDLLIWILLALDIALTIPTTLKITTLIKSGNYSIEDFHPCCRFYKVLAFFYKYPDYINNIDSNYSWMSVFDDIARVLDWPSYFETAKNVSDANKFFHNGNITIYQDLFLAHHMKTTMDNNNGAIFRMFRNMNIPIIIHFPQIFVLITYSSTEVQEMVIDDNRLMGYFNQDFRIYDKFTEDGETLLQEIFINDLNMQLYNNIYEDRFKCIFSILNNCRGLCSINNMESLFDYKKGNCFVQGHIIKECQSFITRINNNKN